MGLKILN